MKNNSWIWIVSIALLGSLLYIQTLGFEYSLDDGLYAKSNRVTVKGLDNWTELFRFGSMNFIEISPTNTGIYRPFTLLAFALESELIGEFDPAVSHSVNLVLYFSLLIVLGIFLVSLAEKKKLSTLFPFLVLLLFAVHPLHVEVVASAKSRDTLLSALFSFGAVLIWWRNQGHMKLWLWGIVLSLYFISLISKEESIPMIAFVGLLAYFFLGQKPLQAAGSTLPFVGVVVVYLIIRGMVLDSAKTVYDSYINSIMYLADGSERLATNFYIYLQYIKLLIFPHPLSWDYSFSQLTVQNFSNPIVWLSMGFFGGLIYLAYRGFKDRNLLSFGLIFYFATFSIFANLIPSLTIGSNLGERFMFIPSLAFAFVVVLLLFRLGEKIIPQNIKLVPILIFVPILLGFTWKTVDRAQAWESNLTITRADVISAPNSWRTHTFYAEELRQMASNVEKTDADSAHVLYEEARKEFEIMLGIFGKDMPVSQYLGSYAEVLFSVGDSALAVSVLEENIRKNPKAFYPLFQLGRFAFDQKKFEEAETYYLKALEAQSPNLGPLYRNLGLTYSRKGEREKAVTALVKSLEYWDDPQIRNALGFLYSELGQTAKAAQYLAGSQGSSPEELTFISAVLKGNEALGKNDFRAALAEYQKILPIYDQVEGEVKFPSFYAAYAKSLLETGDTLNAKANFLIAANEMKSTDPVVFTNLGAIAFMKDKNYAQAEQYYQQALDLGHPDKFGAYSNLGMSQVILKKETAAAANFEKALEYGSNKPILGNLYLLYQSMGNTERASFYRQKLNDSK